MCVSDALQSKMTHYNHGLYVTMTHNNNNNDNNNNDNEVVIKREPLVLPEVGALYRKKRL